MDWEKAMAASRSKLAAIKVGKKRFVFFMLRSELQPCAKLHLAVFVTSFRHRAKTAIIGPNVRECKALVIRDVEHLGADLQLGPLLEVEFLRERHVQVADPVAAEIREMPRSIAGDIIAGILEASLIQIRSSGPGSLMEADTGPELRADHVGPLIAISQTAAIGFDDRHRLSRLQSDEAFQ